MRASVVFIYHGKNSKTPSVRLISVKVLYTRMHIIDHISQISTVAHKVLLILYVNNRKINWQTNSLIKWHSKYYLPCFYLLFLYNYVFIMFYNIILFKVRCSVYLFVFLRQMLKTKYIYIFVISYVE